MSWGLGHFGVLGRSFTPFDYDADTAVTAFAGGGGANNNALPAMNAPIPVPALGVGVALAPGAGGGNIDAAAELAQHLEFIANISLEDSSDQCIPKIIDSLQGIKIVGSSAGHRHSPEALQSERPELLVVQGYVDRSQATPNVPAPINQWKYGAKTWRVHEAYFHQRL